MPQFEIAGRPVGPDYPPLVIAEIGINHNGDIQVARAMIDAVAAAGGEIVKFQSHVIEDEMSHHARDTIPGNADVSIYDIMESCALTEAEAWDDALTAYREGIAVAEARGDKQAAKEMGVFMRRIEKRGEA